MGFEDEMDEYFQEQQMKKEQTINIDTSEYKYHLLIDEDIYFANSIWSLIMEVLTVYLNRRLF